MNLRLVIVHFKTRGQAFLPDNCKLHNCVYDIIGYSGKPEMKEERVESRQFVTAATQREPTLFFLLLYSPETQYRFEAEIVMIREGILCCGICRIHYNCIAQLCSTVYGTAYLA